LEGQRILAQNGFWICADGTNRKAAEGSLNCCNQGQNRLNPLSLLWNSVGTKNAIFAPAMRFLWVSQLYRQYIAPPVKYIAYFTFT
jgi:hypothetical protein